MVINELLLAGIYTVILALGAGFIGYLLGARELRKIIEERIIKVNHQPSKQGHGELGGAVKQITPQEIAAGKDDVAKRIKELLS